MREIKFRAWQSKEGTLGSKMLYDLDEVTPKQIREWDWVLMQYIGIKDKNGKEIYEDDIIAQNFENELGSYQAAKGVVLFCPSHLGFEVGIGDRHWSIGANCEVVGNIHENPDLIPKISTPTKLAP